VRIGDSVSLWPYQRVNAQEKIKEELLESLRIGAEKILTSPIETKEEGEEELLTIETG